MTGTDPIRKVDLASGPREAWIPDPAASYLGADYAVAAFDVRAERVNAIFAPGQGTLEARVVGTHTGEFAGIAPTGREIRVPLVVTYELQDGLITEARIYVMINVLLDQISG